MSFRPGHPGNGAPRDGQRGRLRPDSVTPSAPCTQTPANLAAHHRHRSAHLYLKASPASRNAPLNFWLAGERKVGYCRTLWTYYLAPRWVLHNLLLTGVTAALMSLLTANLHTVSIKITHSTASIQLHQTQYSFMFTRENSTNRHTLFISITY